MTEPSSVGSPGGTLPPEALAEGEKPPSFVCDLCGKRFEGAPGGSGLFMWTRGGEVRTEEPPLCELCANKITLRALCDFEEDAGEE